MRESSDLFHLYLLEFFLINNQISFLKSITRQAFHHHDPVLKPCHCPEKFPMLVCRWPPSPPTAPGNYWSTVWLYSFAFTRNSHAYVVIPDAYLWVWVLLLSMIIWKSPTLFRESVGDSFLLCCMNMPQCVHAFTSWWTSEPFPAEAMMNKAVRNIEKQVFHFY